MSFIKNFPLTMVLMIFIGLGLMLHTASSNTILQTITEDDKRGRVMSFYTMAIMGTAPFGSLLAGFLAKVLGTQVTILIGGAVCVAGALMFQKKLPELKTLVRPVYIKMGIIPEVATALQSESEPEAETAKLT
jgi:MFS family permease